jgi:5-methylthioribose kinase
VKEDPNAEICGGQQPAGREEALTPLEVPEWLGRHGIAVRDASVSELGGGVSNQVFLVESREIRLVVKQSLGRLRVEEEWLSDRDRIFREADAMRWLEGRVRGGHVPRVLVEDTEEFAIAMEAAPAGAEMWKSRLFRGEMDPELARAAGVMLGSMIHSSRNNEDARRIFGDQAVFYQLRIDPYYRFTAARHPELAEYFESLIHRSAARRVSLTHGDWSPKNLLVGDGGMWAIDWEVIHYGDPSFDVAFLVNHLALKSIAMPAARAELAELAETFVNAVEADWIAAAALEHVPALLLARVDGKSPAEYLDAGMRDRARDLARGLMQRPAGCVREVFER